MRTLVLCLIVAASVLLPGRAHAQACQPGNVEPFQELLAQAEHVVIVHVLSAEIDATDPAGEGVVAHVQVAESVRGKPLPVRTLRYQGFDCWGVRMDVGQYFLLATRADGSDQRVDRFHTQVMSLQPFGYLPPEAWTRYGGHEDAAHSPMRPLRQAIAGKGPMPLCDIARAVARASSGPAFPPLCK